MKRFLALIFLTALAGLSQATELTDAERYARLQGAPITLYPETALRESSVVAFFNQHARAEDALVYSYVDALKGGARVGDLGVAKGEVWIYVPGDLDLTQAGRNNVTGARGLVFIPPETARPQRGSLEITARNVAERAQILGLRMIAGLEPRLTRSLANVSDVARHASIFTLYDPAKLRRPREFRAYAERIIKEARAANPAIKIELAISTGADEAASKALTGILWNCSDLFDRIGIYCNDSAESRSSLALYFKVLRGSAR